MSVCEWLFHQLTFGMFEPIENRKEFYVSSIMVDGRDNDVAQIKIKVNKNKTVAVLSTGSTCSIMNGILAEKWGFKIAPTRAVVGAPGGRANVVGKVDAIVHIGKHQQAITFYVYENADFLPDRVLLGIDALAAFKMMVGPAAKIGDDIFQFVKG